MFLDKLSISDLIIFDSILLLIILFFMFKWFFKEVRDICKEPEGIIKFGQISFILLSWSCFIFVLIYFAIKPKEVSILNIFLTIVVGFLGTSAGFFFGAEAIENLRRDVHRRGKTILSYIAFLEDVKKLIKENRELKEQLEKKSTR